MPDLHSQLAAARETFGRFLRNWRKANGWVITTPQDWARVCPEIIPPGLRVSSGQWANLENAQIKQAQPSTFLQLAALNQGLASKQRGRISDDLLKQRVASGQPICRPDGTPWGAEDWFACYIGNLQGPAELWPKDGNGAESSGFEELKQRYLALVEKHKLRPITAMVQLLRCAKDLSTEQQLEIEGGLLQDEAIRPETLPALQKLLETWEANLTGQGKPAKRGRTK
ncbi:MAG: hypothetical protein WD136_01735 [Cyanobium sp.]